MFYLFWLACSVCVCEKYDAFPGVKLSPCSVELIFLFFIVTSGTLRNFTFTTVW